MSSSLNSSATSENIQQTFQFISIKMKDSIDIRLLEIIPFICQLNLKKNIMFRIICYIDMSKETPQT